MALTLVENLPFSLPHRLPLNLFNLLLFKYLRDEEKEDEEDEDNRHSALDQCYSSRSCF